MHRDTRRFASASKIRGALYARHYDGTRNKSKSQYVCYADYVRFWICRRQNYNRSLSTPPFWGHDCETFVYTRESWREDGEEVGSLLPELAGYFFARRHESR